MNSRKDIINFILEIENNISVNELKFNNIHIWPLLRIKLFFHLINKIEKDDLFIDRSLKYVKPNFLINLFKWPFYAFKANKFKSAEYLFLGASSHRVLYKGYMFNRFFDSLINQLRIKSKSIIIDYDFSFKKPIYNNSNFITHKNYYDSFFAYYRLKRRFKKNSLLYNLNEFEQLSDILLKSEFCKDFKLGTDLEFLKFYLREFKVQIDFFEFILRKINPKIVFTLCYYSDEVFAMNCACFINKIKTLEIQHGPNSETHAAYAKWSIVPSSGYELLPDIFWCWDDFSVSVINNWNKYSKNHCSFNFGNPWIDFLEDDNSQLSEKYILYTLQPLSLKVLFTQNIIETIRESKIKWFLRLHPKQLNQKNEILEFLKSNKIQEFVEIDLATKLPLPILIKNCCLHVSNYSGTIIEAQILGKFSIIMHELGKGNFKELLESNQCIYINSNNISSLTVSKYLDFSIKRSIGNNRIDFNELFKDPNSILY